MDRGDPGCWGIQPLKRLFSLKNGATPKSDKSDFWDGEITWITPADLNSERPETITHSKRYISAKGAESCAVSIVPENSIIISTRAPIGSLGLSGVPLCTNQGCRSLIPTKVILSNFFLYLLYSAVPELQILGKGTTFLELSSESLASFHVCFPPLPEQQAIASFLDRECGKIDALIAEQERLIALLAEKRQAVISHAVTKGLNPNAPMKDSGIPWIGMVPEGWEILSLNKVVRDFVDYRGVTPNKVESGIPLITASCIKHGRIDHSIDPVFITEEEYNRRMTRGFPREGDVILTTEAPLGEVAIVEDELISPGQRMILFKLDEKMSNFYMRAYYLSDIGRQELRSRASGSTASGIRADRLRASAIPVPPLNEQKEICAYINRKTSAFESLEQQIRYELDLLKERRAALISAAVTGKIDVRAQSKALAA
ncbi:hypothetical protein BJI49_12275 [Acetobacter pasteurianus]|nr:hypothetical protein BJI49_12275 [Acetobacter pasteurianus]